MHPSRARSAHSHTVGSRASSASAASCLASRKNSGAAPEFNRDAKQLAALALEARLPTVCEWADLAHAGCMIGYGPSRPALRKRMAAQIAQIFRGAVPGEVAIELPTVFEFAINQKVAKSLRLTIPPLVLGQADEVIE